MKNKFIRIFFIILISIFVLISTSVVLGFLYLRACLEPVCDKKSGGVEIVENVDIPNGMSVYKAAKLLEEKSLIKNADVFYFVARYSQHDKYLGLKPFFLKSGLYEIKNTMTVQEIMDILSSGIEGNLVVVVPEGLTLSKIANVLAEKNVCSVEAFKEAAKNKELLANYKIPADSFEGYLFPDTYYFLPDMDASKVILTMVDNFYKHISTIEKVKSYTPEELHEKVILSSIIEREYRVKEEAPIIASVFVNRLEKGIGLYSCATVEYIITEIEGLPHPDVITYKDLKRTNPYNTYKWKGLPPGPISNPGMVALTAGIEPADTNYFYFRVTDSSSGRHTFSETFDEHAKVGLMYTKKAASR